MGWEWDLWRHNGGRCGVQRGVEGAVGVRETGFGVCVGLGALGGRL